MSGSGDNHYNLWSYDRDCCCWRCEEARELRRTARTQAWPIEVGWAVVCAVWAVAILAMAGVI